MENVCLRILSPYEVEGYWPVVSPWIFNAVGEGADQTDMTYIRNQANTGAAQIWIVGDSANIEAVLVTEAAFYGGRKTLVLRWLCGKRVEDWTLILDLIENWALNNQFERIEAWGRKGWEKALRPMQYAHEFTVVGKSLIRRMH